MNNKTSIKRGSNLSIYLSILKSNHICLNSPFKTTRVKPKCFIDTGKRKQGR